jgi:hypothetical protein
LRILVITVSKRSSISCLIFRFFKFYAAKTKLSKSLSNLGQNNEIQETMRVLGVGHRTQKHYELGGRAELEGLSSHNRENEQVTIACGPCSNFGKSRF